MLYISLKARLLHHSLFPPKYSWGKKKKPQTARQPSANRYSHEKAAFSIQVLT